MTSVCRSTASRISSRTASPVAACRPRAARRAFARTTSTPGSNPRACFARTCFWCEAGSQRAMTMRDGLPGIASEEAESKVLLLGNAHRLSWTDLGDLALARGLRLRLLFKFLGLGLGKGIAHLRLGVACRRERRPALAGETQTVTWDPAPAATCAGPVFHRRQRDGWQACPSWPCGRAGRRG